MQIAAHVFVSLSEITEVFPTFTPESLNDKPDDLKQILFDLGMSLETDIEIQDNIMHRNRFGQIVQCTRWVGDERTDEEWLKSGYASQAAKDKAKGGRLLLDMYRLKGEVE